MKQMALLMIVFYQKHLSPHKGFSCAYRQHTGHASCSNLGYRAIRRFGVFKGIGVIRMRFSNSDAVYKSHHLSTQKMSNQSGFCDLPCDSSCDLDILSAPCELVSACGNCSSGGRIKKMGPDIYLPPDL